VNGARRWISVGPMSFQPSELAKLAVLLYAADYMVRKMEVKERFFRAVIAHGRGRGRGGHAAAGRARHGRLHGDRGHRHGHPVPGRRERAHVLPDRAADRGGLSPDDCHLSEWRRERIFAYLDPWSEKHALGKGYQLSHSLIAIGRGEIFGVGLGGSVEKLHWLPEAHTDFLLAVIGEEFGLIGVLVVIGLFFWLTRRIMHIGRQAIALDRCLPGWWRRAWASGSASRPSSTWGEPGRACPPRA
jgi:cell division protein FtsW